MNVTEEKGVPDNIEFILVIDSFNTTLDPGSLIFKDLSKIKNLEIRNIAKEYKNFILRFYERAALSPRIERFITLPFYECFYDFLPAKIVPDKHYYVLIVTTALAKIKREYLVWMKERHKNLHYVPLLFDSLEGHSFHLPYVRNRLHDELWDVVLCFEKKDAIKHKFLCFGFSYYSKLEDVMPSDKSSDIYYIGRERPGREFVIGEIYNCLKARDISCNFTVSSNKRDYIPGTRIKTIRKLLPYNEVVAQVKSTNCILEYLQAGQTAQTLRYFEAVVYNKKFLSNNPNLKNLPFYDERYMRYFAKLEDIDCDWVKERVDIDYGYKDEFSPLHLIDFIKKEVVAKQESIVAVKNKQDKEQTFESGGVVRFCNKRRFFGEMLHAVYRRVVYA